MEEMHCYKCNNSRTKMIPKDIQSINNDCRIWLILKDLVLDENRIYYPHFSLETNNEEMCFPTEH